MARGRFIFLLNPDTELIGNTISQLMDFLNDNPEVGIVGPFLYDNNYHLQQMPRLFPTFEEVFFDIPSLAPFRPHSLIEKVCIVNPTEGSTIYVDWILGAAMMIRREVYTQIGLLDSLYLLYSEEKDFCFRAKSKGWKIVCYGKAKLIHHGGKSSEQVPIERQVLLWRSDIRFFLKHKGFFVALLLRVCYILSTLYQYLYYRLTKLFRLDSLNHRALMNKGTLLTLKMLLSPPYWLSQEERTELITEERTVKLERELLKYLPQKIQSSI